NVIAVEPTRLQDVIRVANNLMDQKLKGYARNVENKRRFDNNPRDNHGQQPTFKRQNVGGQNVARAYTAGSNERKGTPDWNQPVFVCYECGGRDIVTIDVPKLRNQNRGNKTGNKTGSNEATSKAYVIGGVSNPDSNVITGMFLLNNCYASMLFDSGADRSFVSYTCSALLDVALSTTRHECSAVELVDGRISKQTLSLRLDWLAKYHAVIIYDKKIVRIPYGDKVLIIRGEDCDSGIISKKAEEKSRISDLGRANVREFLEVLSKDLCLGRTTCIDKFNS
ncbi:hypothetical protein Tco_1013619, partial [Tanacetum coccineum]